MSNCKYCNGTYRIRCPRCSGQRYITDTAVYSYRDDDRNVPCYECGMRGWIPCYCVRTQRYPHKSCRNDNDHTCAGSDTAHRFLLGNDSEQSQ